MKPSIPRSFFQPPLLLFFLCLGFVAALQSFAIFRDVNYEFAAATTLWVIALGAIVILFDKQNNLVSFFFFSLLPLALALLFIPFRGACNAAEGILFYLLIPAASACLVAGLMFFISCLATRSRRQRLALYAAAVIGSLVLHLVFTLRGPGLFLMEPFFGYVHGPVYDELIPISRALFFFRCETLVMIALLLYAGCAYNRRLIGGRVDILLLVFILLLPVGLRTALPSLGLSASRARIKQFLTYRTTRHTIDVYLHPSEARNETRLQLFLDEIDYDYDEITKALGIPDESVRTAVYVYGNGDLKKQLMGARDVSIGNFFHKEVHLNTAEPFSHILKHELVHVLAGPLGVPVLRGHYLPAVFEGLAVAVTWDKDPLSPHEWSRVLIERNQLPSMRKLFSIRGFWGESMPKAYTAAGSFIRYLLDHYPIEYFHCLYRGRAFDSCYPEPLSRMEETWRLFIQKLPITKEALKLGRDRFSVKSVFQKQCPHESARLAHLGWTSPNPDKALDYFACAYQKSGCSPEYLFNIYSRKLSTPDLTPPSLPNCARYARTEDPPYLAATKTFFNAQIALQEGKVATASKLFADAGAHPFYRYPAAAWCELITHGLLGAKRMTLLQIVTSLPSRLKRLSPLLLYTAQTDIARFTPSQTLVEFMKMKTSGLTKTQEQEIVDLQMKAAFILNDYASALTLATKRSDQEWINRSLWSTRQYRRPSAP